MPIGARRGLLLCGVAAALLAPAALEAADPAFTPPLPSRSTRKAGTITPLPCPVPLTGRKEGVDFSCGTYTVPLDYAAPSRGAIDLTYRVIRATGPGRHPDPIVPLSGGPGQSALLGGGEAYASLGRDVVQLAQRGTLFSQRVDVEECVGLLVAQGTTKAQLETLVTELGNCAAIQEPIVDPVNGEPVSSAIPTLVLQGDVDVRTPRAWGEMAARTLENGTLALVPQQGHEVWTASSPCVNSIAEAFVSDPATKPDLSCLARRRPVFVLP